MKSERQRAVWLLILPMALLVACGFYSFSGSLAPHLRTIAVPLFDNQTAEFGVSEEMTDWIIDEFSQDNTLKIADPADADILLEGSIATVDDRAGAFDQAEQVQDVRVYVTVAVTCTDQIKREVMWKERLTQWGTYEPAGGPEERAAGIAQAIEKISQEILNKTVSGW
ncbi:LptE family protein [candidate division KSB1 bacterium]|nr:LptE family protein [candidate division KSB1 bacterium]